MRPGVDLASLILAQNPWLPDLQTSGGAQTRGSPKTRGSQDPWLRNSGFQDPRFPKSADPLLAQDPWAKIRGSRDRKHAENDWKWVEPGQTCLEN